MTDVRTTKVCPTCGQDLPKGKQSETAEERAARIKEEKRMVVQFFEYYKEQFDAPKTLFTKARIEKLRLRLKDCGPEMLAEAILRTAQSPFHRGDNDRGWKADLDFIIRKAEQVEKLSQLKLEDE